ASGNLLPARVCRRRWADQLWRQHYRRVSTRRWLRGANSQRRKASRLAGPANGEVRADHQPQDGEDARPDSATDHANDRRRGDRVMKRRDFITLLGGAAVAWPLAAPAQQVAMPVVALVGGGGGDVSARYVIAFRKGLNETGTIEGQNATVEYHWLEGQYDRLPSLMADLVRRRVAVIATPGSNPAAL